MCELFAMSSLAPATVRFSLEEFSRHGGLTGPHNDGWGIAYYEDGDVRLVKEPHAASDSACIRFIQEHPFSSSLVVSHIRKATQGAPVLRNCQPFTRELGGAMHVFAHNGNLDRPGLHQLSLGIYRPIGETDSEYAFCSLLDRLHELWLGARGVPPFEDRLGIVADFAAEIGKLGPANFLYSDGDALFAHGNRRMQADQVIRPPGLHVLCRRCAAQAEPMTAAGLALGAAGGEQQVVLFASVPLTAEAGWQALQEGELIAARTGAIVARAPREVGA